MGENDGRRAASVASGVLLAAAAWLLVHLADGRDIAIDGSGAVPLLMGAYPSFMTARRHH